MPHRSQRWFQRLAIHSAYGQLIALIFVPIALLAIVGASVVLAETARSSRAEQRAIAEAILARYQPASQSLVTLLETPDGVEKAHAILQSILAEAHLRRAALVDKEGRPRLSIGYAPTLPWPAFPKHREVFGPLHSDLGSTYGQRSGFVSDSPIWLVVDIDDLPLQLARLRVWLALIATGLVTLLLLLLCLNFYSRRWISPIYEMRLQVQRMTADTLYEPLEVASSGELGMLQRDMSVMLKRLDGSFDDLRQHTEQTEDDLRKTLDALEMQNITYRKARDSAIQANTAKSAFLANISHELRTPLNSIDGFINLLLRKGHLSSEQSLYVDTIRKSSAHLLALINDVLDFSKIEAGKLVLEQAPFHLEEAVYDVMDMLSPLACEKQLDMAVYYYDDVPLQVSGDVLRFKQILTNLVSNAIKFTPSGDIVVRVRLEDSTDTRSLIHVSVQDSGIGLSNTDTQKLFESFGQGDPSVTRQFGGTGLGLAISRQLAKLMGGDVGFENNQDQQPSMPGATFWFSVYLGQQDPTEVQWPDLNGQHVLAFLQHSPSMNVLRGYLHHLNARLEEASSVADLLVRISDFNHRSQHQGWVIVDHDTDSDALLKEIRTRHDGPLAVYDYQMAIDPINLMRYHARSLHEPIHRKGLLSLFKPTQHPVYTRPQFDGKGMLVLAVDDHPPNLLVLDALLSDLGVQVVTVSSGQEAIDQVQQRLEKGLPHFDLIFMDIQMPRMSGLEATQWIRQLEQLATRSQHTPIVALTAHALSDEREQLLSLGMDDYVGKPIQQEQLVYLLSVHKRAAGDPAKPASDSDATSPSNLDTVLSLPRPSTQPVLPAESTDSGAFAELTAASSAPVTESAAHPEIRAASPTVIGANDLDNPEANDTLSAPSHTLAALEKNPAVGTDATTDPEYPADHANMAGRPQTVDAENTPEDDRKATPLNTSLTPPLPSAALTPLLSRLALGVDASALAAADPEILNWAECLALAANKADLARDLLQMLLNSLPTDMDFLLQHYHTQDYGQLEQRAHRMYGATRYTGVPGLRLATQALEQLLATERQTPSDDPSAFHLHLGEAIEAVQLASQQLIRLPLLTSAN